MFASRLGNRRLSFCTTIGIADPDSIPGFTPKDLPKVVQGTAKIAMTMEDVLDCMSAEELWSAARDNHEVKTAIQLRCREKLRAANAYRSMADIPEFFVGSGFYASLVKSQAIGSGKFAGVTLEGCASAVLRLPTIDWKPFNKAKRKADGAEPLRAHLTKSGAALRLMAWQCSTSSGEVLEFANVGEKWEEEIAYTDPADAI